MRRLVHISDLHFGQTDPVLVESFVGRLGTLSSSLLVVSGDLTQRATRAQFAQARAFLQRLDVPGVIVPGNHDIPLWNVVKRLAGPLDRYREFIDEEVEPSWVDEELAVLGVNTARSLTWKEGRISVAQIGELARRLRAAPAGAVKVIVTHHPFVAPERAGGNTVGRAGAALRAIQDCGVDLVLAGHLHAGSSRTAEVFRPADRGLIVVQAGTTLSLRRRGEANSFNVIDVTRDRVAISLHRWEDAARAFVAGPPSVYVHRDGWRRDVETSA